MEHATYEVEAQVHRRHWWFQGRRKILRRLLAKLDPPLPPHARVLDVGCGTGANGVVLGEGGRFAVGLDASTVPLGLEGTSDGYAHRLRGDAGRLPVADASFDMVVALDILEHLDDDQGAARELHRVCKPGGVLVVFVPALALLFGFQDEVALHRRRYGREQLRALIAGAGFGIERLTFFNTFLFPPILAARLLMNVRRPKELKSENEVGGPITNRILETIFSAEAPLVSRFNLPVGVSLACLARR